MSDAIRTTRLPAAADLAEHIDAVLPQTQCTKCGFAGCRPYAEAIATGGAEINQCPPGGAAGIDKLSLLTGRPAQALNPANGIEAPLCVAVIDESLCIGCTLCIQACPVDAIVGAAKLMHTVLASLCTGCDLCVPPCPMDCIAMVPVVPPHEWSAQDALAARERFEARKRRLFREQIEIEDRRLAKSNAKMKELATSGDAGETERRARVAAAIERARERRRKLQIEKARVGAQETDR